MKKLVCASLIFLMMVGFAFAAGKPEAGSAAADYPQKTITVVVGNAAGGGSDVTCRIMTKYLPKYLDNATVVVTNNAVGSGEAAFLSVASAAPDGYFIGFFHGGQIMRTLMLKTQYQIENYKYIAQQTYEPRVLVVRIDDDRFPDLESFVEYAKQHPGEITCSDSGFGSSEHFAQEAIMHYADIEITPVHTNGTAESKVNLLGGHTDALCGGLSEVVSLARDKQVRLLGITSDTRNEFFPDLPTFKEKGIDAVYDVLRGFYCGKDVPQEIVDKLSEAMRQVSQDPEFLAEMKELTLPATYRNSKDFTQYVMDTKKNYQNLLKAIDWKTE